MEIIVITAEQVAEYCERTGETSEQYARGVENMNRLFEARRHKKRWVIADADNN